MAITVTVHAVSWRGRRKRPAREAPARIVELGGFEPPTLSMPWRCATSCAIAPSEAIRFMRAARPVMNQPRNHHIMQPDGFIVELGGFEPPTLSMPWRCATSCAIAPSEAIRFMRAARPVMNQPRNHHIMQPDGFIVELGGFEPPTLSMPWRCATSCAIAPFFNCWPVVRTSYTLRRDADSGNTRRVAGWRDGVATPCFGLFPPLRRYRRM